MGKRIFTFLGIISVVLLLAACGGDDSNQEQQVEVPTISDEEKLSEDELVVTINDEEVTGATYNLVYTQLKLHAVQTGQEYTDEELQELTIDSVIDRQLLIQQAAKEGIVISDEDATEELQLLKTENEAGFETMLEQYQITEKLFHHQLIFEMTMNEYLREVITVEVTNDEVKEVYEEAKAENENLPELVEIHDTLKDQIESQKRNEALQVQVDEFKEQSDIELHL